LPEEVTVGAGSRLDGKTVAALHGHRIAELVVLALHTPDGNWVYNPGDALVLVPQTGMVFTGSPDARTALEHAASPAR